jgi:hypothetical protein
MAEGASRNIYRELLGESFDQLHPHLQVAHSPPLHARGFADVDGASSPAARVLARLLRLPRPGLHQPLELRLIAKSQEVFWVRSFNGRSFETRQFPAGTNIVECAWPAKIVFNVSVEEGVVMYRSSQIKLLGLPLPRSLAAETTASVIPTDDGWVVRVAVRASRLGLLCSYQARIHSWT